MQFNSAVFFVFLIVFFSFWSLAKIKNNSRWLYLIIFSLVYYGWNHWQYIFLLLFIGLLDFATTRMMAKWPRGKKILFILALSGNLLLLIYFKYAQFLAEIFQSLLLLSGVHIHLAESSPSIIAPLGISFYTFQSLTYVIDVYQEKIEPVKNPFHLMAFLFLFPLLLSGPINRAKDLLPQLSRPGNSTEEKRWEGFQWIIHGFFKKIVIADNLAPIVSNAFDSSKFNESSIYWWLIITFFAWQIYCDFSGYTDIARGLGKWMGFDFPRNFNHPYSANSIREFWNRWHITLSQWLRDYVFLPLSYLILRRIKDDSRLWIKAENRAYYLAIFATMLVCGLWHGAALTFLVWGGLHALFISIERLSKWPRRMKKIAPLRFLIPPFFLLQIWITWVFFRANSLSQAWRIVSAMFRFSKGGSFASMENGLIYLGIILLYEWFHVSRIRLKAFIPQRWYRPWEIVAAAMLIAVCIFLRAKPQAFIYFQF